MKWIILLLNIIFIQTQAQNIDLYIFENNIHIKGDTLYFNFKIQNNRPDTIVLYNLNYACNGNTTFKDSLLKSERYTPRLLVDVFNENNELPNVIRARTGPKDFSKFHSVIDKYTIIKPNEIKEYNIALDIWPINLKKGIHKVQLRYFSNNIYDKSFEEAKKTDINLKNSIMYKGILRSNIVSITVD